MSSRMERLNGIGNIIANSLIILMSDKKSLIRKIFEIRKLKKETKYLIKHELFRDEITFDFFLWLYRLVDNLEYHTDNLYIYQKDNNKCIEILSNNERFKYLKITLISYNIMDVEFKSSGDYLLLDDFQFRFVISTRFNTDETEWSVEDRNRYMFLEIVFDDMIVPFLDYEFPNIKQIVSKHYEMKRKGN